MQTNMSVVLADPLSTVLGSVRDILDAPKKLTTIRLRWLVVIICSYLLLFSPVTFIDQVIVHGFVIIYLLSNASLYLVEAQRFESAYFFSPLVIFDTLCLTFSLVITGQLGTDLYLAYFLIIVICSFWQDFRWTLGFAVLITAVYAYLLFLADGLDASSFLRLPFLFISSLFYSYFTQLARSEKSLQAKVAEAETDFLTGLSNRRAFEEKIKAEFEAVKQHRRELSFLMIDVDDFKKVNDLYGHQRGDDVLKKIGEYLSTGMRGSDFAARYGGEEFAVVLPETALGGAMEVAQRICSLIERTSFPAPGGQFSVTVSIGIGSTSEKEYSAQDQILKDADQALYLAKSGGKNRVEIFKPKIAGDRAGNSAAGAVPGAS